jgi:hypothetical protein
MGITAALRQRLHIRINRCCSLKVSIRAHSLRKPRALNASATKTVLAFRYRRTKVGG